MNPDEIEMVNIDSGFVVGNQCGCPGYHGIPLLSQHSTAILSALSHVAGRQSSLPVPGPFKRSIIKDGTTGPKVSCDGLAELGALMEEKKRLLIDLLQKDSDPASIENLRKEMAGIQDEIQKEVITHIMESKKILDPNQQQRFFDLMRQSMTRAQSSWSPTNGGK